MSPSFAQLGVPQSICQALEKRGITSPFAIQAATISDAMNGRDVCGRAPTGSGKTLAFGIPLVATVEEARSRRPRALVLAPTRELADQIHVELSGFAGPVRIGVVYGGVGYGPQLKALRQGIEILVACPGRLEDLIARGDVDLSDVDQVVIDEADRMADMGFLPTVRRLLDQTSDGRQTVLFSATLDGDIAKLTRDYQHDPVRHEVGEETPDVTAAHHVFWETSQAERTEATAEAINAVWPAIVFCRTRHGSDRLAKRLSRQGIKTAAIHGGRSQNQRTRALRDFAENRVHALVATDVAARGIHVDGVAAVIHYDPPEDHKAYIHRSGRTARAGESGVVLSLIQPNQRKDARKMQRKVGIDTELTDVDGTALRDLSNTDAPELAPSRPEPSQSNGRSRSNNNSRPNRGRSQNRNRNRNRNRNERSNSGSRGEYRGDERDDNEREDSESRTHRHGGGQNGSKPGAKRNGKKAKAGAKRNGPKSNHRNGGPKSKAGSKGRPNKNRNRNRNRRNDRSSASDRG